MKRFFGLPFVLAVCLLVAGCADGVETSVAYDEPVMTTIGQSTADAAKISESATSASASDKWEYTDQNGDTAIIPADFNVIPLLFTVLRESRLPRTAANRQASRDNRRSPYPL